MSETFLLLKTSNGAPLPIDTRQTMRSRVHFRPAAIGLSGVSARAIAGKFRLNEAIAETAPAFLERVSGQARSHRAVHHPYLRALASGGLSDSRRALKDFARHWSPRLHFTIGNPRQTSYWTFRMISW